MLLRGDEFVLRRKSSATDVFISHVDQWSNVFVSHLDQLHWPHVMAVRHGLQGSNHQLHLITSIQRTLSFARWH